MSGSCTTRYGERLSVGVVGGGKITSSCHLPVLESIDEVSVEYVADVDRRRARLLAGSYDARPVVVDEASALPESDVALLATPVEARAEYVEEFGARGTPLLSEKPFAPDVETHEEYRSTLETVSCNYLRLSYAATRQMRRIVDSGILGDLREVRFAEGGVAGPTGRAKGTTEAGGGMLLEMGCHGLSQLSFVLGEPSFDVESADVTCQDGYDVDVDATLVARTDSGRTPIEFRLTRIEPVDAGATFVFENGVATFAADNPEATVAIEHEALGEGDGVGHLRVRNEDRWATTFAQGAYLRWRNFLGRVREDPDATADPATMPEVTALIDDLYGRAPAKEVVA